MLLSFEGSVACVPSPTPPELSVWTLLGVVWPGVMPNLPPVPCAAGSGWKSTTALNVPISPSGEVVQHAPIAKLSWLRARGVVAKGSGTSGAVAMARFSTEMGRQKALPIPGGGLRTIASDQWFLHFANPWQWLMHSFPALRHLHRDWVPLEHAANLVLLQHLAWLLDDDDRLCRWWAFGLREVSDGAVVCRRLIISVELVGKPVGGRDSSAAAHRFPHMAKYIYR
jgi:hypothetical protein